MKSFYLSFLLLFGAFAVHAAGGHNIKIKVKGVPKDSFCYIGYHYGKNQYIKQDTAKADANGVLIFKGKNELPGGVYILSMPHNYIEFLIGEQNFSLETDTSNPIVHMKVKGSSENEIFYEYQRETYYKGREADSIHKAMKNVKDDAAATKVLRDKLGDINKEVSAFRKNWMAAHPNSFAVKLIKGAGEPDIPDAPVLPNGKKDSTFAYRWFKAHYFDNMDLSDDKLVRTPFFNGKLEFYFKNLVPQIPDSINYDADRVIGLMKSKELYKYTVWYILNTYENSSVMGMDAVLVHMGKTYYLSGKAYWADSNTVQQIRRRVHILDPILIGKTAPDLKYLTDSLGKVIPLYSVKSKYTLLYFWDFDCGHCQHETPLLHDYYVKHKKDRKIEVYAACICRTSGGWKKWVREHKIGDWINVWDSFTVTDFNKMYDVYSTPVLYVLDENKKIIAKRILSDQLDELFDKLDKIEAEKEKEKSKKSVGSNK